MFVEPVPDARLHADVYKKYYLFICSFNMRMCIKILSIHLFTYHASVVALGFGA